jgi:hypothetical protein
MAILLKHPVGFLRFYQRCSRTLTAGMRSETGASIVAAFLELYYRTRAGPKKKLAVKGKDRVNEMFMVMRHLCRHAD